MRNTKIFGVLALWLSTLGLQAQLKFKALEKINGLGDRTIFNKETGAFLSNNLVSETESIVHTTKSILFTRPGDSFKNSDKETLKKYKLTNGKAIEVSSMVFPSYSRISFFDNGSFVLIESAEHGGRKIEFYSSEFQLLHTILPFSEGYAGAFCHNNGKVAVVGINSYRQDATKVIFFNSDGNLLFEKQVNFNGIIGRVLSSDNFLAVYSYNVDSNSQTLFVLDKNGNLLWHKLLDENVQKWCIQESSQNTLVIASSFNLYSINCLDGSAISKKALSEIYKEAKVAKLRPDEYVEVADIQLIDNGKQVGVLLFEPINSVENKNNILYLFSRDFKPGDQKIQLGDSKGSPRIKVISGEVLIIKDKEILYYGVEK